ADSHVHGVVFGGTEKEFDGEGFAEADDVILDSEDGRSDEEEKCRDKIAATHRLRVERLRAGGNRRRFRVPRRAKKVGGVSVPGAQRAFVPRRKETRTGYPPNSRIDATSASGGPSHGCGQ